jgi:hypothetical protein
MNSRLDYLHIPLKLMCLAYFLKVSMHNKLPSAYVPTIHITEILNAFVMDTFEKPSSKNIFWLSL